MGCYFFGSYNLNAAKDLYGANSAAVTQVTKAWNAVGVKASTATAAIESNAPIAAVTAPALKTTESDAKVFRVYPNPVKNQFTMQFAQAKGGTAYLTVYNMNGTKVHQQVVAASVGTNRVNIAMPALSAGSYIVKLNNEKVTTIQVVR